MKRVLGYGMALAVVLGCVFTVGVSMARAEVVMYAPNNSGGAIVITNRVVPWCPVDRAAALSFSTDATLSIRGCWKPIENTESVNIEWENGEVSTYPISSWMPYTLRETYE